MPNAPATKAKPRKPTSAVATQSVPDLAQMEQFVADAMAAQQSAISPDDMVKEQMIAGLRGIEREIAANDDEISLIQRLATALLQVRNDRKELLDRAAARYRKGLDDLADQQQQESAAA